MGLVIGSNRPVFGYAHFAIFFSLKPVFTFGKVLIKSSIFLNLVFEPSSVTSVVFADIVDIKWVSSFEAIGQYSDTHTSRYSSLNSLDLLSAKCLLRVQYS